MTNILRLDFVVGSVVSNYPALKAARANWEAMKERVPQARAWEDPRLGFDTVAGRFVDQPPNAMTDHRVTAEQTLPISGRNRLRARAAGAEAVNAFEELRRRELDAIAGARNAYYRLATAHVQLELNGKNTALLKQFAELTRAKFETGTRSQADVLSAERELAKQEELAFDFRREVSDAGTQLNVLMNKPPRSPLGRPALPAFQPLSLSADKLETMVLAHRPELLIAESNIESAEARLKAARREWVPEPGLRVAADRYNAASQAVSEIGVGITIPLPWFNRTKYQAGVRENQKLLEKARYELESVRMQTLGMLRDQLQKVETFHHHTDLFGSKLLPLAEQTVTSRRLGYETDKAGLLELLDAQREAQEVESMYWDHFMHYLISVEDLEAMVGIHLATVITTTIEHHPITK